METIYIVSNYLQEGMGIKPYREKQDAITFCDEQKEQGWTWASITFDPILVKRKTCAVSIRGTEDGTIMHSFDITGETEIIERFSQQPVREFTSAGGKHFSKLMVFVEIAGFSIPLPN